MAVPLFSMMLVIVSIDPDRMALPNSIIVESFLSLNNNKPALELEGVLVSILAHICSFESFFFLLPVLGRFDLVIGSGQSSSEFQLVSVYCILRL